MVKTECTDILFDSNVILNETLTLQCVCVCVLISKYGGYLHISPNQLLGYLISSPAHFSHEIETFTHLPFCYNWVYR